MDSPLHASEIQSFIHMKLRTRSEAIKDYYRSVDTNPLSILSAHLVYGGSPRGAGEGRAHTIICKFNKDGKMNVNENSRKNFYCSLLISTPMAMIDIRSYQRLVNATHLRMGASSNHVNQSTKICCYQRLITPP